MRKKPIVILLGTFDTKPDIFNHLYTKLMSQEWEIRTINTGTFGSQVNFIVDYDAEEVAGRDGTTLQKLVEVGSRSQSIEIMGIGAREICTQLCRSHRVVGIIGAGGGGGTYMALQAMQAIPFGTPKICITTLAAKDLSVQMGAKDIVLVPSVVDVSNLNSIIRAVLDRSAAMLKAMIGEIASRDIVEASQHKVAISMFGNTTPCVEACLRQLESNSIEVFTFHATGVGGRTMESLTTEGLFDGIIDITTTELADNLCGGICDAGSDRLTAGVERGLPQIVVPGCLDMVNFAYMDQVPPRYKNRNLYSWSPDVTLMRTNQEENRRLGAMMMEKLNRTRVPICILIPLQGISTIDKVGSSFHDAQANLALYESIKSNIKNELIEYIEVDHHINDEEFAEQIITYYFRLIREM
ncbi:MAG TPA: Tm-1-like ATP-binding domain-containing protein [Membranihabitans sp.]|nr:Tm-1-like ATP-binding domain-containing protein [Membranihabitans sp.]